MPPEGSWRPNVSLESVLVSVHVLLGSPNFDDPVRPDLISEWQQFIFKIKENTETITDDNKPLLSTDDNNPLLSTDDNKIDNKPVLITDENSIGTGKRNFSLSLSAIRKKSKTEFLQELPK